VSHRISTVRMADLIVVMDGAHSGDSFTHGDLMRAGGNYAQIYAIQTSAYQS
jgi:ATP-binding cassette subfamily B protein